MKQMHLTACEELKSITEMSEDAVKLAKNIYKFICEQNGVGGAD
ncbi:MAG: hypothetical protein AB8H86_04645 [Polyangiales bacterium]